MAITASPIWHQRVTNHGIVQFAITATDITLDSSYPAGGEAITAANLGLSSIIWASPAQADGYTFEFDHANSKILAYAVGSAGPIPTTTGTINDNDDAATQGGAVYAIPRPSTFNNQDFTAEGTDTGLVTDSDTAATEGVAIYVVEADRDFHPSYQLGYLTFVSPTNADGTGTVSNGGATYYVKDSDSAATDGVAVRAVAAGGDLEATTANAKDILVPLSDGTFIFINHATTGSTPELYFDEDATNSYERLRGVIVDNLDETFSLRIALTTDTDENAPDGVWTTTDDTYDLVYVGAWGPLTYAVGSGGPTCIVQGRPEAASLPGAAAVGAKAAAAGLDASLPTGRTGYVPLSNGEFIEIAHAASPAGVQLYANPGAASTDLTLECVVVDNADETFTVSTTKSMKAGTGTSAGDQVVATTDLSAVTTRVLAYGPDLA